MTAETVWPHTVDSDSPYARTSCNVTVCGALPAGYTLVRERVTWMRWDPAAMRNRISHPVVVTLTDPEGYARTFDTVAGAHAWLAVNVPGQENGTAAH